MGYIYRMEYYSAIKKTEIVLFAGKWMEVKMVMLTMISQVQKDKYCKFLLTGEI
jgi:hypothetical protein